MLDIRGIERNNKIYNGTNKKFGITLGSIDYIIKFRKSYDMSVYCEYVASSLIRRLGIPCHDVILGKYGTETVSVIKDFTSGEGISLHSFSDVRQSSMDIDISHPDYTYSDVVYLIDKHLKMSPENRIKAKQRFWDMFICDAILGNRDRHWGNWGYLQVGGGYVPAPLYDNSDSLFPEIDREITGYVNEDTRRTFLYDRVYSFPIPLFKLEKGGKLCKSNYADMFSDLRINKVFAERTRRIKDNVSYEHIFNMMVNICSHLPLGMIYRRFYIEIVTLRYMCIVLRICFEDSYNWAERALLGYE